MKRDFLQSVLLAAASEQTLDSTLNRLVTGLAAEPAVALARVWLSAPGDICDECPLRSDCADQTRCLHLAASAGESVSGERWNRTDGSFRRMPFGARKVGTIAASRQGSLIQDVQSDRKWIARPDWARAEGIHAFAGHPLAHNDEILGVLAIFSREPISEEDFRWIRMFADHAAASIANAYAYDEIHQLHGQLEQENEYLREEVQDALEFGEIISASPALRKVLQQVELVAPTDASVLVQGESGTGKELIARSIHERSRRRDRPMIKVNCANVPKELFESEFFGHVRGSFTGAVKDRVGRFELANGGTLFLDEVGEIPIELQSKLLRVLQEGEFERVGDSSVRKVDVRVISATNRDLPDEIQRGGFRQDLFYRLSVFPIEVPPLRDRPEDIPPLAQHFIECAAKRHGLPPIQTTRGQMEQLAAHEWPGNVRELQHVIERAVILAAGGRFDPASALPVLKKPARRKTVATGGVTTGTSAAGASAAGDIDAEIVTYAQLKDMEHASIRAALAQANGRVYGDNGAAELLGTKPTTLASRMKALGIRKPSA